MSYYKAGAAAKRRSSGASYPADLVLYSTYDSSYNFTYVRDGGNGVGTATGTPAISSASPKIGAGNLELVGNPEYILWEGAGLVDACVQQGTVEFWYKPNTSGSPSATHYLFCMSQAAGSSNNGIILSHASNGYLYFYGYDQDGANPIYIIYNWGATPVAGTWYHLSANWNLTAGSSKLFLDGTQIGVTDTSTATRSSNIQYLAVGRTTSGGNNNNFGLDDLRVYAVAQRTGNFTPPTAPL